MSSRMEEAVVTPRTVDEARDAVERSRQRISSTLDALEDRIVEKKQAIQDKVDVLRPVREQVVQRPFTAVAVAAGVGALLGSLGGGEREKRTERDDEQTRGLNDDERAELQRLREYRRERERELSRGREAQHGNSRMNDFRQQLTGALTSAIGAAITARVREFARDSEPRGERTR